MQTFGNVTRAIAVLGLRLTPKGELEPELIARLDRAVELYRPGVTMIVCGSHSFIAPGMGKFNEADRMAQYLKRKGIEALEEDQSDSIQTNLLMLRLLARNLRYLTVVSAEEVERRVTQAVEWFFPRIGSYAFEGCPEPRTTTPAREQQLYDDFECIVRWYAGMEKGDPKAYLKLLDGEMPRWDKLRAQHHSECPSRLIAGGQHWSESNPRPKSVR